MRANSLFLAALTAMAFVCPSDAKAGYVSRLTGQAKSRAPAIKMPSKHDKDIIRMRVVQHVTREMPDAEEDEVLKMVDKLTEERLREAFPDAYKPEPKQKLYSASDDIWENGTVVKYIARVFAVALAMMGLYAFKDAIMGRETWDGQKIRRTQPTKKDR